MTAPPITAPSPNADPIFAPDGASAYLGRIAVQTLARWRSEGRGPEYVRLSTRRVGYRKSALDVWLQARIVAPNDRGN